MAGFTNFTKHAAERIALVSVVALSLLTVGCATTPNPKDEAAVQAYKEANDPLEPMNRYFFEVNYFLDEVFLKPFAGYYRTALPQPAQDGVRNFARNLHAPVILANDLFQGEGSRAGQTAARFLVNTTLGIGGFIDVADLLFGMPYHDEDFGQTLAVWGSDEGPYLHLPFFGPSNPRDLSGRIVDYALDPLTWVGYYYDGGAWLSKARSGVELLDTRARNLESLAEIQKGSIDFYATIRSLYRQKRNDLIHNGETPDQASAVTDEGMIPDDGAEMPGMVEENTAKVQPQGKSLPTANGQLSAVN